MRPWPIAALIVAAVMGLGYVHPFGNPRVESAKGLGTLLQGANIPADAKAVLVTKCADCHSNETRWPVYATWLPRTTRYLENVYGPRRQQRYCGE